MKIYITGDTHIPIDISKLNTTHFPEQKEMTKDDFVIIAGDFGGIWNRSDEEIYWIKWLNEKNFTTLFVDGNHENFDLLNSYKEGQFHGGKVHRIAATVYHLMRGQVFDFNGYKFFTMGGGESIDRMYRQQGQSWWAEEIPSDDEFNEAIHNLDKNHWVVDYVVTHTASFLKMNEMGYIKENNQLTSFLNLIEGKLNFRHWYFGHFHRDQRLDEQHTVLYNQIVQVI